MVIIDLGPLLLVTQAWLTQGYLPTWLPRSSRVAGCPTLLSHSSNPSGERSKHEPYSLGLRPFLEVKHEVLSTERRLHKAKGNASIGAHLAVAYNSPELEASGVKTSMSISGMGDRPSFDSEETLNIYSEFSKAESDASHLNETSRSVGIDEGVQTHMINELSYLAPTTTSVTFPTSMASRAMKSPNTTSKRTYSTSKQLEPTPPWSAYLQTFNSMYQATPKQDKNVSVSGSGGSERTAFQDSLSSIASANTNSIGSSKKGTDLLTLHDLESILLTRKYIREIDLKHHLTKSESALLSDGAITRKSKTLQSSSSSPASKRIAFPQPSPLDDDTLSRGCVIASGFVSMLVATSLIPSFWLMGAVVGGLYGSEVSKRNRAANVGDESASEPGPLECLVLYMGRRLALFYLRVYDACNALFFMWKTGQLSYEYYKAYATFDERFAIQSKIDAWNTFFVEGKIAFDKWEKENEVGRKILAGLRTAWLVEERSLKNSRRRRQSKYRIVQLTYDAEYFGRQFVRSVWKAVTGGGSNEFRDFLKGVKIEITDSQAMALGSRLGSVMAAVIAVNLTGALFAISPSLLSFLAAIVGIAWPTWTSEFFDRVALFTQETRARGRGDTTPSSTRVDKSKYHYFIRDNGKKRYYRTGRPWFGSPSNEKTRKKDRKNTSSEGWDWRLLPWS